MTPEERADLMWRVRPSELQNANKTRAQFYAEQIRAAENDALELAAKLGDEAAGNDTTWLAEQIRALKHNV
jgi:hypothetical protein